MAAALKKRAVTGVSGSSLSEPRHQLVGATHEVFTPSASPARELQASLVNRLQSEQSQSSAAATDMIAGTFAATCLIGLLFLAIV